VESGVPVYEAVIGLEVHAQLETSSKIFCGCSTAFGAPPNTQTCPVCLGHPGALPVLNGAAVDQAVLGALALGCTIHERSFFARKNYFYPDLPKGYQISQYDQPLATGGAVPIEIEGESREIRLERLQLEEDAGKSIHDGMPDSDRASYVDLNRAGIPLVEIVSRPELASPEEAQLFLERLRSIMRYIGICQGNLEEGSMRCDANVSIRPRGSSEFGTRTELKNLNSFRHVRRALAFEIERHAGIVEEGGHVVRETLLWDESAARTRSMREKEEVQDYRYFPEPDLPPLILDPARVDELRQDIPELPHRRKKRFVAGYELPEPDAHLLTVERELADYFEDVAARSGNPRFTASFVINDLLREQKESGRDAEDIPLPAQHLAELIRMIDGGAISHTAARDVFEELYRSGRPPAAIVRERDLGQVSDPDTIGEMVRRVIESEEERVREYRGGKTVLFEYFVGRVMKESGGRANPKVVHSILKDRIG
jgi:aspartyl-tRNA(Asn)/glutamyl-tRNA(Gln) amidotransferase subunit B